MYMLNEKMILTDDNDWVKHCMRWEVGGRSWRMSEEDLVRFLLRITWKVQACPKRMCSLEVNGEGELRGNRLTQVHLEKWPLKQSMCFVYVLHSLCNS